MVIFGSKHKGKGRLRGAGNVFYLDWGGDFMVVLNLWESLSCILNDVPCFACILYVSLILLPPHKILMNIISQIYLSLASITFLLVCI